MRSLSTTSGEAVQKTPQQRLTIGIYVGDDLYSGVILSHIVTKLRPDHNLFLITDRNATFAGLPGPVVPSDESTFDHPFPNIPYLVASLRHQYDDDDEPAGTTDATDPLDVEILNTLIIGSGSGSGETTSLIVQPAASLASRLHIPVVKWPCPADPKSVVSDSQLDQAVLQVSARSPDLLISIGTMELPISLVEIPPVGVLVCHTAAGHGHCRLGASENISDAQCIMSGPSRRAKTSSCLCYIPQHSISTPIVVKHVTIPGHEEATLVNLRLSLASQTGLAVAAHVSDLASLYARSVVPSSSSSGTNTVTDTDTTLQPQKENPLRRIFRRRKSSSQRPTQPLAQPAAPTLSAPPIVSPPASERSTMSGSTTLPNSHSTKTMTPRGLKFRFALPLTSESTIADSSNSCSSPSRKAVRFAEDIDVQDYRTLLKQDQFCNLRDYLGFPQWIRALPVAQLASVLSLPVHPDLETQSSRSA